MPTGIECHYYPQCTDGKLRHERASHCRTKREQGGRLKLGVLSLRLVFFLHDSFLVRNRYALRDMKLKQQCALQTLAA